jgi:hypothetical protein
MALRFKAIANAPPEVVWALVARPAEWSRWAPHVRGAWRLGAPEVEAGRSGAVRVFGLAPVPARITAKDPGRSWSWKVGPVAVAHRVEAVGAGSAATFELTAPPAIEPFLRLSYGPLTALLARNLARVAAQDAQAGRP